jgi:AcrR family transcriptional regulator
MSPKIVDKQAKRAEIAAVALDVFAEHGLDVSVEKIAKAAKIGKGTIYQYYRSKTELISESVLAYFEQIDQLTQDESQHFENPEERLRFEIKRIVETIHSSRQYSQIVIGLLLLARTKEGLSLSKDLSRSVYGRFVRLMTNRILEGISQGVFRPEIAKDAERVAINMIALADGIWLKSYVDKTGINPEKQLGFYLDRLIEDLRRRPSMEDEGTNAHPSS